MLGTRPRDGLSPNSPHAADGMRIDPPPSLPCAIGTMPDATAAAEPPLDPPGERDRSCGLRVGPWNSGSVEPFFPSSGVLVMPSTITPAARARATARLSAVGDVVGPQARAPRGGEPGHLRTERLHQVGDARERAVAGSDRPPRPAPRRSARPRARAPTGRRPRCGRWRRRPPRPRSRRRRGSRAASPVPSSSSYQPSARPPPMRRTLPSGRVRAAVEG